MPPRTRIPFALTLAALAATAATAAPAAHATWSEPVTVVGDGRASNVRAAGSASGYQAFVWRVTTKRVVRLRGQTGNVSYVRARIRPKMGRLGKAQTISSTRGIVTGMQIAVDNAGNATAVWTQAGAHLSIMAAYRPHGKRFGKPFELGRSTAFNGALPQLAVGPIADAVIAWNAGRHIQVVRRDATKACSSAAACIRKPLTLRQGSDHTVAIGPRGNAYVVWAAGVHSGEDFHTRLRMIVIRRSGLHFREHFVSGAADGDASQPALAVRGDGTAFVAWRGSRPAGGEQDDAGSIRAVTSTPDAIASPTQTIATGRADRPQLRADTRRGALLAWRQLGSTAPHPDFRQVVAALAPAGSATFGPPLTLSPDDWRAGDVSLAVDAAGSRYVAYGVTPESALGPAEPSALSRVLAVGDAFGPAIALPASFGGVRLVSAGARVSAVSGAIEGRTLLSDFTP